MIDNEKYITEKRNKRKSPRIYPFPLFITNNIEESKPFMKCLDSNKHENDVLNETKGIELNKTFHIMLVSVLPITTEKKNKPVYIIFIAVSPDLRLLKNWIIKKQEQIRFCMKKKSRINI